MPLLIWSCSSSDATSGLNQSTGKSEANGAPGIVFSRVDLGTLGGPSSYAAAINANGTVVGWSETAAGTTHAFRWSAIDGLVDLGTLPGDRTSQAIAILDDAMPGGGQILGVSGESPHWTPVVWSTQGDARPVPIPLLPNSDFGFPEGFNARGEVVGWDAPLQHGWIWSAAEGKYDLSANVEGGSDEGSASAINAAGVALLTTRASTCRFTTECWRSYLWTRTTGYQPIGTPGNDPEANVTGLALNDEGAVAGWVTQSHPGMGTAAYRWAPATGFVILPNYSTGGYGYATAMTANGTVVGASWEPTSGSIVASAWTTAGAIVRLSPSDPNPSVAVAVNKTGTIAGWRAISNGVNHAVTWSASAGSSSSQTATLDVSVGSTSKDARIVTASTSCLTAVASIGSRQKLFACVMSADMRSRGH